MILVGFGCSIPTRMVFLNPQIGQGAIAELQACERNQLPQVAFELGAARQIGGPRGPQKKLQKHGGI